MTRALVPVVSALLVLLLASTGCNKDKSDSVRLTNMGMKALGNGNLGEARLRFDEAITLHEENANAHYGLGVVLVELDKAERGRKHLAEAVRLKPALTEAMYQLGALAVAEGKLDEAAQQLRQVLEQDAEHSAAHHLMAQIHEKKNQLSEADQAYRRSIVLDPYQPNAFLSLARLYLRVAAEKEAMAVLREGLRLCTVEHIQKTDTLALLHNELGILLQQNGQYGMAIVELLKAVRLPGAQPEVVFNLGWGYANKGEAELALKYFNQYIQLVDGANQTARIATDVAQHLAHRLRQQKGTEPPVP